MFDDPNYTGTALARAVQSHGTDSDVVLSICGVSRRFADAVSTELGRPLRWLAASTVTPDQSGTDVLGAVASDGSVWLDEDEVEHRSISQPTLNEAVTDAQRTARRTRSQITDERRASRLEGKTAVVVDDGTSHPTVVMACLRNARAARAKAVVLAVVVAESQVLDHYRREADDVVYLQVRSGEPITTDAPDPNSNRLNP